MSCEQVEELLSTYLDKMLAPEEYGSVTVHVQECQSCQAILNDYRRFDALLAQLPPVSPGPAVRQKLFSTLAQDVLLVKDEVDDPALTDRHIYSGSLAHSKLILLPGTLPSSTTTPTRRQPALRPSLVSSNTLHAPVVSRKKHAGQRAILIAVAAALLLALGLGGAFGWQIFATQQGQQAGNQANAITPPAGYSQNTMPLPAGTRFVFWRAGALWSASIDTTPSQAQLTPQHVMVGVSWVVSPATGTQSAGNMLAYIDIQHGYVHVIRSDGQNDTTVPQPLLPTHMLSSANWQTAEEQTILKSLVWSPDGQQLAFVADPQGSGQPSLYIYSLASNSVQIVTSSQGAMATMPVWSPDSVRVAFALTNQNAAQILDYNTHSKSSLAITTISLPETLLSLNWSPNATLPALTWSVGTAGTVQRVELATIDVMHTPHVLAQGDFSQASYAQAANDGAGGWLLVNTQPGQMALEDVNLNGGIATLANGQLVTLARWSPSGSFVDYLTSVSSTAANTGTLYVVTLANGHDSLVASGVESILQPAWSADSQMLAYSTGQHVSIVELQSSLQVRSIVVTSPIAQLFWSTSATPVLLFATQQGTLYAVGNAGQSASKVAINGVQGLVQWTQVP